MFPSYIGIGGLIFSMLVGIVVGVLIGALLWRISKWVVHVTAAAWLMSPLFAEMWNFWYVHIENPTDGVFVHIPGFYLWFSIFVGLLIIAVALSCKKREVAAFAGKRLNRESPGMVK